MLRHDTAPSLKPASQLLNISFPSFAGRRFTSAAGSLSPLSLLCADQIGIWLKRQGRSSFCAAPTTLTYPALAPSLAPTLPHAHPQAAGWRDALTSPLLCHWLPPHLCCLAPLLCCPLTTSQLKRQEEEQLLRSCPFAPVTGRAPHHPPHGMLSGLPVSERLYAVAQHRQRRREGAGREDEDDPEAAECTFAPRVNREANERQLDACSWRWVAQWALWGLLGGWVGGDMCVAVWWVAPGRQVKGNASRRLLAQFPEFCTQDHPGGE